MTRIAGESRTPIDGQLVEAARGRTYANVNPATEEYLQTRTLGLPAG